MPALRYLCIFLVLQLAFITQSWAGDFDWLKQLSVQAQADPSGFVARLSARFQIGDAEVRTVISNVGNQADAYMVLRLAEMSHHSVTYVTREYHEYRHRGWGVLARRLGIKPGSRAFHALKAGDDLGDGGHKERRSRGNGHGHGNGKSHGHHGNGNHGRGGHGHGKE